MISGESEPASTGGARSSDQRRRRLKSLGGLARSETFLRPLLLLVTPGVLVFVLGVRAIEPTNGQDGYLYVGAVARLRDFLTRFPDAYYGARFGYILPSWVFTRVLGFESGFYALRLGLLGAVCVLMGLRGSLRPAAALLATVIFCTAPIVLVATFNTYTLSTGVLTLVLGSLLLATTGEFDRSSISRVFVAGMALGLSWNSHFVALPVCGVVFVVFIADQMWTRRPDAARQAAAYCAAFALGTGIVVISALLIYGLRFDLWNVYGPTLAQAGEQTDVFYLEPGWRWLSWRHYLLVGPLAVVAGAVAWRCETNGPRCAVVRRLTLFSGTSLGLFAFFQWFQDDPLLATYFYSALPLALSTATLAVACAVIVDRDFRHVTAVAVAAVVLVPTLTFVASRVKGSYAAVLAGCVVAAALAVFAARRAGAGRGAGVGAVLAAALWAAVSSPHDFPATPGGFRTDPRYDDALFAYDTAALDRAKIVDSFARALPSLPRQRGELRVWFDAAGPFDQLSAPFVWYRSALQAPGDAVLPNITPTVRDRILIERPRYVVIVDGQEVDAAQGASRLMGLAPYRTLWHQAFTRGQTVVYVILLERAAGTWPDYPCDASNGDDVPQVCP